MGLVWANEGTGTKNQFVCSHLRITLLNKYATRLLDERVTYVRCPLEGRRGSLGIYSIPFSQSTTSSCGKGIEEEAAVWNTTSTFLTSLAVIKQIPPTVKEKK